MIDTKNAEGYLDMTAYKAIKNVDTGAELYKGDIMEYQRSDGQMKEVVILANHGKFSTVLMLSDNERLPYAVKSREMRYTAPRMVNFVYNQFIGDLIRSMKMDEYNDLMAEVIDSFDFDVPEKQRQNDGKTVALTNTELVQVKEERDDYKIECEKLHAELTGTKMERDIYKQLYDDLINNMLMRH